MEGLNPIPGLVEKFVAEGQLLLHSPDGYYVYDIRPCGSHPYVQVSWRGTRWAVAKSKVPISNPWRLVNDNGWRAFRAVGPADSIRHDTLNAVIGAVLAGIPLNEFRCGQMICTEIDYMKTWGPNGARAGEDDGDVPF